MQQSDFAAPLYFDFSKLRVILSLNKNTLIAIRGYDDSNFYQRTFFMCKGGSGLCSFVELLHVAGLFF